jgi:hypothetical protein
METNESTQEKTQLTTIEEISESKNDVSNDQSITDLIKKELLKILTAFFNEIDLVFDYIDKTVVENLQDFLKCLSDKNNLKKFTNETISILQPYEKEISYITNSNGKIKTTQYNFLNNVVLFNQTLDFKVFVKENKNTKRSIVKYLYNIYMSVFILNFGIGNDNNDRLNNFINGIQERILNEKRESDGNLHMTNNVVTPNIIGNGIGNMGGLPGNFGNLIESFMGNTDIMKLATDLSKDIENENLDPMMLLTSMMSGKPNKRVQDLVQNISNKIESKINNGEINKDILEEQAKNILHTVNPGNNMFNMFDNNVD